MISTILYHLVPYVSYCTHDLMGRNQGLVSQTDYLSLGGKPLLKSQAQLAMRHGGSIVRYDGQIDEETKVTRKKKTTRSSGSDVFGVF